MEEVPKRGKVIDVAAMEIGEERSNFRKPEEDDVVLHLQHSKDKITQLRLQWNDQKK